MSTPKTRTPKTPKVPEPAPAPEDFSPTRLGAAEWALIDRSSTLLFHIPAHASQARLHGYDEEEHKEGKRLVEVASGRSRSLNHWMAEQTISMQPSEYTAEQMRLLQDVDAFENMWFPRVRAMIQRCIPAARVEAFLAVFFKDLTQQPLGRSVLDSTSLLISRFEELAKSAEPGAKEVHALGVKRGLTPKKIAHVRGLITAAQAAMPEPAKAPLVPVAELIKAREEQIEAVEALRLWYNDWATTFRGIFPTRVLVRLGLTTFKRAAPAAEETEEEEEEQESEEEASAEDDEANAEEDEGEEEVEEVKPAKGKAQPAAKKTASGKGGK